MLRKFGERSDEAKGLLAAVAKATLGHFDTMKNFARRLVESFRTEPFSELATTRRHSGRSRSGSTPVEPPACIRPAHTPVNIVV